MKELYQLLYKNADMIDIIDKIIFFFHAQNFDKAFRYSTNLLHHLDVNMNLIQRIAGAERAEYLNHALIDLLTAQETKDYVLQADLYELQIRPFLVSLQEDMITSDGFSYDETLFPNNREAINQKNPSLCELIYLGISPYGLAEKGYEIEFSSCGLMTCAITDNVGRYYLHSNNRISDEAYTLASSWYEEEITTYIVYGYGLGYHIKELLQLDSSIHIVVYESDLYVLKLAAAYTRMAGLISKSNLELIYDPKNIGLLHRLSNLKGDEKFVIHYPSLRNVRDTSIKDKLENYFVQYSSVANQLKLLNGNFLENIKHFDGLVDELKDQFINKDLFIVAAGPSLDKNFHHLKAINHNTGIILATGTVFKKLLAAGIPVDYIIVTDPNERVYTQIAGYEKSEIPMLYLSTAFRGFSRNYQGKKYMILQKDYNKSEDFALKKEAMLVQTGGSVSTTALDLGITFGCRRIIFLGLDLAYTDNYVHAAETSRRNLASTEDLRQVEDIHGKLVYTSRTLDMYRQWIEKRIKDVQGIEFIDATEGGAKIKGMKTLKMSDLFQV